MQYTISEMPTSSEHELIALEKALWHEKTLYDAAFQERHFAADFFEFGRSGRAYSREDCIVADGPPIHAALHNFRVRTLAPDLVQVTYDSVMCNDAGSPEHARRSSIWCRTEGVWLLRFHQDTLDTGQATRISAGKDHRTQRPACCRRGRAHRR